MNNPIDIIKTFLGRGGNIRQFIEQQVLNGVSNQNPMIGNLIGMANKGDVAGLEKFARNICKERGMNYDKEFSNLINNFKR